LKDNNSGQSTATTQVVVNDVPPAVTLGVGGTIQLGATFSASGSFTDPGAQTWSATVDYGDGTVVQKLSNVTVGEILEVSASLKADGTYLAKTINSSATSLPTRQQGVFTGTYTNVTGQSVISLAVQN